MRKTLHSREYRLMLALLVDVREARGKTQVQLAADLKMRQSDLSKIERGVRRIDFVELRHWLIALDFDAASFSQEFERRLDAVVDRTERLGAIGS